MLVALVLQGRGHRREAEAPTPFDGAADFVSRFVVGQWVTFPRFVLSGAWHANLQRARRPRSSGRPVVSPAPAPRNRSAGCSARRPRPRTPP